MGPSEGGWEGKERGERRSGKVRVRTLKLGSTARQYMDRKKQ